MENKELINRAAKLIRRHHTGDGRLHGDVGAVVLSSNGQIHEGVCVDTASWGLCAERSAIAAMITSGEYRIRKVVAVWQNDQTGELHVLPPCGVCREFMRQIDGGNLDAEIVLGLAASRPLRELIPEHAWPEPLA
jgi:cytidine deaminase